MRLHLDENALFFGFLSQLVTALSGKIGPSGPPLTPSNPQNRQLIIQPNEGTFSQMAGDCHYYCKEPTLRGPWPDT